MTSPYAFYYVTDDTLSIEDNIQIIERCAPWLSMVQLREKNITPAVFLQKAKRLRRALNAHHLPLIINDDVEIAMAIQADGLHIGQSDGDVCKIRAAIGNEKWLGLTVETPEQLKQAQTLPVDYLGISSVFNTTTKQDIQRIWGLDGLNWAIQQSQKPIVAIGGITHTNIESVLRCGCDGVAVISALSQTPYPEKRLQHWHKLKHQYAQG